MAAWGLVIRTLALIVAVVTFVWQVITHRREKAEAARASLSCEANTHGQFLSVLVVNTGDPPLYIKKVELVLEYAQGNHVSPKGRQAIPLATGLPPQRAGRAQNCART